MEMLRILVFSTLVVLSLEQRRGVVGRELGGRSPALGHSSETQEHSGRDVPNSSTQEAEYVYEYYDEPDYQHYPPKPTHRHTHTPSSAHQSLLDSLQGRSVNVGTGNLGTPSTVSKANILATSRERFISTSSTKRPVPLHSQLSRFIPGMSKERKEKSSTEAPLVVEYEYVYEEDPVETHSQNPPTETISVSVSASQKASSTPSPKGLNPESGIVISVATTKSVSSRLNPTPQTTPSPPNTIFRKGTGSSIIIASIQSTKHSTYLAQENLMKEYPENYPAFINASMTTTSPSPITQPKEKLMIPSDLLKNRIPKAVSSTSTTQGPEGIKFEDVSPFLPPDYKKQSPSLFESLLPKIQFQEISQDFLPKDYVMSMISQPTPSSSTSTTTIPTTILTTTSTTTTTTPTTTTSTTTPRPLPPKNPLDALLSKIRFEEDISKLLPPGYKETSLLLPDDKSPAGDQPTTSTSTTVSPPSSSTNALLPSSPPTLSKVVFPTRAGGFKAVRPSTPEPSKAETPAPPKVALKAGWPTRKTTEFTGWPTSSTTPSTTTTTSSTTTPPPPITEPTTTTERTTTTLAPPKRSPATLCELSICKMEATLRLTGGVRWKPEYADINTDEWKHLESTVKRELDGAYRSSGLAPFYRSIEVEAFNEGSVVVDYFLFLDNVDREISSEQVRSLFHAALLQGEEPFEEERLRLGRYSIDPRFTDFKVRVLESESVTGELEEALIPQWGIAVIVIGIASLIFVIIFAVTLVVSRQRKGGKKSGVSLTQEMLTEFNKRSVGSGVDSMRREELYNMEDVWDESQLERTLDLRSGRRSTSYNKEGYNIYDSWKTEWNGYNYQGDSYARRRSDYDTNF